MARVFPLVIKKTGEKFIPTFPVELDSGDQLIVVKEQQGSQVPEGQVWVWNGYSSYGPDITKKSKTF